MGIEIKIQSIEIQSPESNSTLAIGYVVQNGWSSHSKENSAMGAVSGNSKVINPKNMIEDNDCIDAPIMDIDEFCKKRKSQKKPSITIKC